MNKISAENAKKLEAALKAFASVALELSNVLDETGYELTSCPDFLSDADDFAYEISSFVEDEIENINENSDGPHLKSA
jgi:hypothetical protein